MAEENFKATSEAGVPLLVDIDKYHRLGNEQPALLINSSASVAGLLEAVLGRVAMLEKMTNLFACSEDEELSRVGEVLHPRAQEITVMIDEIARRARADTRMAAPARSLS